MGIFRSSALGADRKIILEMYINFRFDREGLLVDISVTT